jgi:hypothetical protein
VSQTDTTTTEAPQVKPFAAFLQEQRKGGLHTELSEGMAEMVQACRDLGKNGTVTIKFTVKPQKDGETLQVVDDVVFKAPKGDRPPSTFFADDQGNLSRNQPRQESFDLRKVEGGASDGELRRAGGQ